MPGIFFTFIYQYIAFKSRKKEYLVPIDMSDFEKVKEIAKREGLDYLTELIDAVAHAVANNKVNILWEIVRTAPHKIAYRQKEFIIQMIDEFQFMNATIYWDQERKIKAHTLAGGYLSSAESKIAPLMVSGSWVGWLMNELITMLPARFDFYFLENMPQNEAVEMVHNYSRFLETPVTAETAYLLAEIAEGSPFYVGSVFRSRYKQRDLTSIDGLTQTFEFETLNDKGKIKATWMEYVNAALPRINDQNAKNIVLYLCQNREREVTRKELLEKLALPITDSQLEKRLKALVKADIIEQGQSNYDYRGVRDNIFEKVFRGVYEKEILNFDAASVIAKEYGDAFKKLKKDYNRLQGKFNHQKGCFAEYVLLDQLRYHGAAKNDSLKSITRYLPADFNFCRYSRVWKYDASPVYGKNFNLDMYARPENDEDYSIAGEIKNRENTKFSIEEVAEFESKFEKFKEIEKVERVVGFIFSLGGFTAEAETYCKAHGIACSDDVRWLDA
ncbi:MAG: hypothetical protein GY757_58030 [bacterium]|nr:hypothetical protein [bacterium]